MGISFMFCVLRLKLTCTVDMDSLNSILCKCLHKSDICIENTCTKQSSISILWIYSLHLDHLSFSPTCLLSQALGNEIINSSSISFPASRLQKKSFIECVTDYYSSFNDLSWLLRITWAFGKFIWNTNISGEPNVTDAWGLFDFILVAQIQGSLS